MDEEDVIYDTKFEFTEANICNKLNNKYVGNCRYKLANVFVFKRDWESDFFVQKQNGYAYEFEVKISRSDFLSDKKKVDKHLILCSGKYQCKETASTWNRQTNMFDYEEVFIEHEHQLRPNKFYYVVPENLIDANEVPDYAGLMYVSADKFKDIITVKEAPFIHKEKLSFENVLCNKFYHYWIEEKMKAKRLEWEIRELKNQPLKTKEV